MTYLLAFFNPTPRTIEDFSQSVPAQRHPSTTKICRSTLSDFNRLVDQEMSTFLRTVANLTGGSFRGE